MFRVQGLGFRVSGLGLGDRGFSWVTSFFNQHREDFSGKDPPYPVVVTIRENGKYISTLESSDVPIIRTSITGVVHKNPQDQKLRSLLSRLTFQANMSQSTVHGALNPKGLGLKI